MGYQLYSKNNMADERKELAVYPMLKSKSAKSVPVKAPKVSSPLSPVGKMLENVNVRPSRMQTAKYDAAYVFNSTKEINNPKTKVGKAVNTLMSGALAAGTAPVSAFNVLSGQSRYNKNKRAGFERGSGEFKVRNSSIPLAETEFNED
jgi:hypothetical protein